MLIRLALSGDSPRALLALGLALVVSFVIGIAFHEFSHALTAYWLGDTTAQSLGRLTLNPIAHLDPAGTLLLFLVGFGWGKPTPVNPYKLRAGPRTGMALVALAGPISNFVMAFLFALPLKAGVLREPRTDITALWSFQDYVWLLMFYVVLINVLLGVFNLIPLAPLDGSKIAQGMLPGELGDFFRRIEPYGMGILMVTFMLSFFSPQFNVVGRIISPLENSVLRLLLGRNL